MREFVRPASAFGIAWLLASIAIGPNRDALAQAQQQMAPARGPATPTVKVASENDKCPAADFEEFLRAFSNSPVLQRRYTRLPLKFGANDPKLIGEDNAFKTRVVNTFEKIPNYDSKSGTVFPTSLRMKKGGLETETTTIKNSRTGEDVFPEETITDSRSVTVLVKLPDTGVRHIRSVHVTRAPA